MSEKYQELATRHDCMEYNTNAQFVLADEMLEALQQAEQRIASLERIREALLQYDNTHGLEGVQETLDDYQEKWAERKEQGE